MITELLAQYRAAVCNVALGRIDLEYGEITEHDYVSYVQEEKEALVAVMKAWEGRV